MNIFFISEASRHDRIIGLDVLRCLAIGLVLIAHGERILHIPIKGSGYFGVELFFVLSGFLIGKILIKTFENTVTFSSVTNFWLRRWFRTLPNYYLFLILNIIIAFSFGEVSFNPYKYALFLQCFQYRLTPIMPESWSLCVEEWFYILFPIWLLLFLLIVKDKKKMILLSILSFIFLFTLARMGVYFMTTNRSWDFGYRCTTFLRLDSIAYGVLFAWVNRFYRDIFFKYKYGFFVLGGCCFIIVMILKGRFEFIDKTLIFSLTNASFAFTLPLFYSLKIKNQYIKYVTSHISIISYSIYLVHFSFVLPIVTRFNSNPYVEYFLYLSLSMLISTIVYNFYEKRMTSLRNKFSPEEPSMPLQIAV